MLRLLIVDDEKIIRETLSEIIDYAAIGYQLIATARNGMEAYDIICDEYPDVVLLDIRMPVLSGLELIERVQKADSEITFVLLSGYSEFEYAKQAMRFGVQHYLLKPADKQELIDTLKRIRGDYEEKEFRKQQERREMIDGFRQPMEQCFLMEAFGAEGGFVPVWRKYRSLLSVPESSVCALFCYYVEEGQAGEFVSGMEGILQKKRIRRCFPVIYVKNCMVLILQADSLAAEQELADYCRGLLYPGQTVGYEVSFYHAASTGELFAYVTEKISRYQQICLYAARDQKRMIYNHHATPSRVQPAEHRNPSIVELLKEYVEQHLDQESLSLKWIAEHELFVSVGHLSKQFVKEEGLRFSDYLNRQRIEEAKRLMNYYHNDNISSIACQVGFGNNPQYFRQVFKKYVGCTPSDYLKSCGVEEETAGSGLRDAL